MPPVPGKSCAGGKAKGERGPGAFVAADRSMIRWLPAACVAFSPAFLAACSSGADTPNADAGVGSHSQSSVQSTSSGSSAASAQVSGTSAVDAASCTCPPVSDAAPGVDVYDTSFECYCLVASCQVDAGPHYYCSDGDVVEDTFAACNLKRITYSNGGGLESVSLFYDATSGAWVGVYDHIDGPDFCGRNIAAVGVHDIDPSCALTSTRHLCPSPDGAAGSDAGDATSDSPDASGE